MLPTYWRKLLTAQTLESSDGEVVHLLRKSARVHPGLVRSAVVPFLSRNQRLLQLEAVGVELEDAGVLGDGALDVFGGSFGELGFYFDGDFEPRVG